MELKALDTYIAIERDVLRYDGSIHSVECLFIELSELEMYLNEGWRLRCSHTNTIVEEIKLTK